MYMYLPTLGPNCGPKLVHCNNVSKHADVWVRLSALPTCPKRTAEFIREYGRDDVATAGGGTAVAGERYNGPARGGVKVLLGGSGEALGHLRCGV